MEKYWLWLSLLEKISLREKHRFLAHFRNPRELFEADEPSLEALDLPKKLRDPLMNKSLAAAEKVLASCADAGIGILPLEDPRFSGALRGIPEPPLVLYWRGRLPELNRLPLIGVVGTRKASDYGLGTAREMGRGLSRQGAAVVSGMAEGIDAAATLGALEGGGTVLGILGSGVDIVYPKCNRELFRAMEERGCLLSEYPPGTSPAPWRFPQRNRIISGLSKAVLVVEAPEKSGSMITARCAMEQGRDIFVVPGALGNPGFTGSLELLKTGFGTLATCPWDILKNYADQYPGLLTENPGVPVHTVLPELPELSPPSKTHPRRAASSEKNRETAAKKADETPASPSPSRPPVSGLSDRDNQILAALSDEETHVDSIKSATGLPTDAILSALTMLELKGCITTRDGVWVKISNH